MPGIEGSYLSVKCFECVVPWRQAFIRFCGREYRALMLHGIMVSISDFVGTSSEIFLIGRRVQSKVSKYYEQWVPPVFSFTHPLANRQKYK